MSGNLDQSIDQFMGSLQCAVKAAYPKTKVSKKNVSDAERILTAYGGRAGELTATLQYFDHYLRFGKHPVADLELCIALVEMRHLELLGDLMVQLGLQPKYVDTKQKAWTPEYIYYDGDAAELLEMDIKIERQAIEDYNKLIQELQTPEAVEVIKRIKTDEEHHVTLFEDALTKVRAGDQPQVSPGRGVRQQPPPPV